MCKETAVCNKSIFVTKPSLPPMQEYIEEISSIWETGIMTHQGPKHQKLQEELKRLLGVDNITLFANGHLALELGIKALGLSGEVITTPFTFGSTTQAILRNGCTPVFCDIKADDFTMNADLIEDLITDKTTAIVPVHVYGNICDDEKIEALAKKHNLKVVYDAAHAFYEEYKGVNVAKLGDASMFSFHATKVFNTVEGGCLVYNDGSITKHLEGLRQFGQIVKTEAVPYIGTNAKMTEMHAAMGLCNLPHMDEYLKKRSNVVKSYRERLGGIAGIQLSAVQNDVKSNFAYFPVVIEEEETGIDLSAVIQTLEEHHVFVRRYFYPLCSDFECVKELGIKADVPVAKHVSERVITLPCYSDLTEDEVNRVCDTILGLFQKN